MAIELYEGRVGANPKQMNATLESLRRNLGESHGRILIPCTPGVGPDDQQIDVAHEIISEPSVRVHDIHWAGNPSQGGDSDPVPPYALQPRRHGKAACS